MEAMAPAGTDPAVAEDASSRTAIDATAGHAAASRSPCTTEHRLTTTPVGRLQAARRQILPPCIRFHEFRHTHATLLLKAAVPIEVVSEGLGHSPPGFTMATYQHVLPGMQGEAARTFAAILEPSTGSTR